MKEKFLSVLYRINIVILIFAFIFGLYKVAINFINHTSHLLSWLTFVSGLLGLFLVCFQIREQQNEHQANLKIYATLKRPLFSTKDSLDIQGLILHIIPVNIGLVSGSYRMLGICKETDWKKYLLPELKKIKKGKIANYGIFSEKMFYDFKDIISKESTYLKEDPKDINDLTGTELLFPKNREVFKLVQPKGVGDIKDFKMESIQKTLKLENYIPVKLVIVYLDPRFVPYIAKIKVTPTNAILEI